MWYKSPDEKGKEERWETDTFHAIVDDEERSIHYHPVRNPLWLLSGPPLEPGLDLWDSVKDYIYSHLEFPDERLYHVATAWIFHTWIREASNVSPYFRFLGTKNTGKTRGLNVFYHLAYRAVLTPSATEAVLYRLCQDYHVTFLLDETEHYSNEAKTAIQNVLNSGYKKGQQVLRCSTAEDGSIIVTGFDVYGPKGIAGTRTLRDTLESRCIQVIMTRNTRRVNFTLDTVKAKELRSKLELWRFRRLKVLDTIGEDSDISDSSDVFRGPPPRLMTITNSRIVELFAPLLALADNKEARDNIVSYAIDMWRDRNEEDATSVEAEILSAIIQCKDTLETGKFSTRLVTQFFNGPKPENEHWKSRSIGRVIKRLGFKAKRLTGGRRGWIFDSRRIDKLTEQYIAVESDVTDTPPSPDTSLGSLSSLSSPESGEG